jgi:hypothetical protein
LGDRKNQMADLTSDMISIPSRKRRMNIGDWGIGSLAGAPYLDAKIEFEVKVDPDALANFLAFRGNAELGPTEPDRKYLRIVFLDSPVRQP